MMRTPSVAEVQDHTIERYGQLIIALVLFSIMKTVLKYKIDIWQERFKGLFHALHRLFKLPGFYTIQDMMLFVKYSDFK